MGYRSIHICAAHDNLTFTSLNGNTLFESVHATIEDLRRNVAKSDPSVGSQSGAQLIETLKTLGELRQFGILAEEEFQNQKSRLLSAGQLDVTSGTQSRDEEVGSTEGHTSTPVPLKLGQSQPPKSFKEFVVGASAVSVIIAVFMAFFYSPETAQETQERHLREQQQQQLAQAEKEHELAETNRKGFHCLSSWDGSHRELAKRIKRELREPSSFEHVATAIVPVASNGMHEVVMDYRARNGFGGMNNAVAIATIRSSDCGIAQIQTVE